MKRFVPGTGLFFFFLGNSKQEDASAAEKTVGSNVKVPNLAC